MEFTTDSQLSVQAQYLVMMLERLSADSYWAHQASGVRGALLRSLEAFERSCQKTEENRITGLVALGYQILEQAAKEIPETDQKGAHK